MGDTRSARIVDRVRIHANGAVTSYLELCHDGAVWSTVRYWIDEISGAEERGDRRAFGDDEAAARSDYRARSHEGLTEPIPVARVDSLLDPHHRFDELVEGRNDPSGRRIELRRGPEGWAISEGSGDRVGDGWSLWGSEERAAADTFRRLAAGLPPMPPKRETQTHRYPQLVERRPIEPEGGVECWLELRSGPHGWALAELLVYPAGERWAPERIAWRSWSDEHEARAAFESAARRYRRS